MLEIKDLCFDVSDEKGQKDIIKNLSLTIDDGKFSNLRRSVSV